MAERKSSGFRFRLPWFTQPSLPPARQSPTQPPRTTAQTSVASTPAQKPPFRPPGKAPAPPPAAPPPTTVTPQPFSPRRSPLSVSTKSSVPKSPTAKITEPVATQPAKETQATTETAPPPPPPPSSPPSSSSSSSSSTSASPKSSSPEFPTAKTIESVAAQPAKDTQTTTETIQTTVTAYPTTPPPSPPFSPPKPNPRQTPPPPLPESPNPETTEPIAAPPAKETQTTTTTETIQTTETAASPPAKQSPISETTEPVAAPPTNETQTATETIPTIKTAAPASPPPAKQSPISETTEPVAAPPTKQTQPATTETIETTSPASPRTPQPSPPPTPPPTKQSPARTPPRSPSQLTSSSSSSSSSSVPSPPTNKPSEIKTSAFVDSKPRIQKSQNPKLTTAKIQADIPKFIHKISSDEKATNAITIAGDNTGALMQLNLDELKRTYNYLTATDHNASNANKEALPKTIVNSNIQGVNNSMMLNSSVTEGSPGVHLGYYEGSIVKNKESIEMQRAEVNVTEPEKVVYDPAMKMKGVFMESIEDDGYDYDRCGSTSHEIQVL